MPNNLHFSVDNNPLRTATRRHLHQALEAAEQFVTSAWEGPSYNPVFNSLVQVQGRYALPSDRVDRIEFYDHYIAAINQAAKLGAVPHINRYGHVRLVFGLVTDTYESQELVVVSLQPELSIDKFVPDVRSTDPAIITARQISLQFDTEEWQEVLAYHDEKYPTVEPASNVGEA